MELQETSLTRPFIERTWASLNLFPTERDLGIHARTIAWKDRLLVDVGAVNGQRLGEPRFALQSLALSGASPASGVSEPASTTNGGTHR